MTRPQMKRLCLVPFLFAPPVAALLGIAMAAQAAESARDFACFEIIGPQRHTEPGAPLLLNRCTGSTWLLVRSGSRNRLGYRWAPLDAPVMVQATQSHNGNVAPKPSETDASPTANCFFFAGRRYCQ
jgi:hypothetical protein